MSFLRVIFAFHSCMSWDDKNVLDTTAAHVTYAYQLCINSSWSWEDKTFEGKSVETSISLCAVLGGQITFEGNNRCCKSLMLGGQNKFRGITGQMSFFKSPLHGFRVSFH